MLEPPAIWETQRLVLKRPTRGEAAAAFESYTADPAVSRYMTWRPHRGIAETEQFLRRCEDVWEQRAAFPWTLWLKSDGSFAGMLEARVKGHSVDIGYVLAPRLWRRGLMSEAVAGLIDWALAHPEIFRVWAVCDVDNVASARLLSSVGMQLEGTLHRWLVHPNMGDSPRDCLCFAIVKQRAAPVDSATRTLAG
jgi:ribosomal-protein-alanine N-acetyltransferase